MSRQKRRSRSDVSDATDASRDTETLFNDVVLLVEGRKIPANGSILAYNSSVLENMITAVGEPRGFTGPEYGDIVGRTMVSKEGSCTPRGRAAPVELVLKDQAYDSVKTLMGFLQTKYSKKEPLSGETALQLLPMTEAYKMTRLKRICAAAILEELETMRRGKPAGSVPTSVSLKYLSAADKYGLEKLKTVCIDECAANFDTSTRKEIADDKHLSDKTKVAVMDKMCEKSTVFYDRKLAKLKKEQEKRYRELEEARLSYEKEMDTWRKDLQEEVNNIIQAKNYRQLYEHLLEQFEKCKKYIDKLENEISDLEAKVTDTIEPLERMSLQVKEEEERARAKAKEAEKADGNTGNAFGTEASYSGMNPNDVINEEFISHLKEIGETMVDHTNVCKANIRKLSKSGTDYFTEALNNFEVGLFQETLSGTYELQDRLDTAEAELELRSEELGETEAMYEKEKLAHEKTRAELVKQQKKVHQVNTWLKWAKPVDDDEKRCTCFRHGKYGTNT